MMKNFFLLTVFALAILSVNAQSNTTDEGVVINGIKWATRNVDNPGTFAANPEDDGMLYQWNRKTAWSTTGSAYGWDASIPSGSTWEKANDPSPVGWRVPTLSELYLLCDTEKVSNGVTLVNGADGIKFTDKASGKSIFLPAAGMRYTDGTLMGFGDYWSSTALGSPTGAMEMVFNPNTGTADAGYLYNRNCAFSLRSVEDSSPNNITDVKISEEKTPVAYYSIMGVQLQKEPQSGIYIIVYDNGTKEKIMRKPQ